MRRIKLFFIWLIWLCADKSKRKTWDEVISGMEPHEHIFEDKPYDIAYYNFATIKYYKCKHKGCYLVNPVEYPALAQNKQI